MLSSRILLGGTIACALLGGCNNPPSTTQPANTQPIDDGFPVTTAPAPEPIAARQIGHARDTVALASDEDHVRALLGAPTLIQSNQWAYVVNDAMGHATATITFVQGKVTAVHSTWKPGWEFLATAAQRIVRGAPQSQVLDELGEPDLRRPGTWWLYAPPDYAPTRVDLFFQDDVLSWGSAYLLARLGTIPPGAAMKLKITDARELLGKPLASEPGAQWTYIVQEAGHDIRATVYFRSGIVSAVTTGVAPKPQ